MNPLEDELSNEDQFQEVEDIFDYLLKQQFITPEDIDMVAAKFRNIFLTIDNKEDFLPFIKTFILKAEGNDEYNEERLEALKTEVESFYDRIATNFSVWHIAGYRDPNDEEKSDKLSEDIDESFSFINSHQLNQNLFGPEIPEKLKPVIIKVLEKISTLYDQKLTNRVQLISKWRYLTLKKQIKSLKKQSTAIHTIHKYFLKKYSYFYKLRKFAVQCGDENERKKQIDYENEIESLKTQISELEKKALNGNQKKVKVADPKIENELKKIKKLYQEKIKEYMDLENELNKSKSLNKKNINQIKKNSLNYQDSENKMAQLSNLLQKFKNKELDFKKKTEEQENLLNEKDEELKRNFTKLDSLMKELQILRSQNQVDSLSSFGKLRYFMKTMKYTILSLKSHAFTRIFKRKEKAKMALMNVTDRIKARLLIQTRNLNCGQDIRRSFLRWMVKANPDLLRELFTKVAITAKLNHQVALWRMKKLVAKPIVQKLPEAVKVVRRLKAFFILSQIFGDKEFKFKKHFVDTINPYHKTKEEQLLEKVLVHNNLKWINLQKKNCVNILKRNRDKQVRLFERLIQRNKDLMKIYLLKLRQKGKNAKNMKDIITLFNCFQRMNQNYRESGLAFFSKFKKNSATLKVLINKLVSAQQAKKRSILRSFADNRNDADNEELKNTFDKLYKKRSKEILLKNLFNHSSNKLKDCFEKLMKNRAVKNFEKNIINLKKKNLINLLEINSNRKLRDVIDRMKSHNQEERRKNNLILKVLDLMNRNNNIKKQKVIQALVTHNNSMNLKSNLENLIIQRIMKKFQQASRAKMRKAIETLSKNNELKVQRIEKLLYLVSNILKKNRTNQIRDSFNSMKTEVEYLKKQKLIMDILVMAQEQKSKQALQSLMENRRNTKFKENMENKLRERLVRLMDNNSREKMMRTLRKLIKNKNKRVNDEYQLRIKQKSALERLFLCNKEKKGKIYNNFIKENRDLAKNNKKQYVTNLSNNFKTKLRTCYNKLKENRTKKTNNNQVRERKIRNIFENIRNANKIKTMNVFSSLKQNQAKKDLLEKKGTHDQKNLIERLVNSNKNKKLIVFYRLYLNQLYKNIREQKQKNLISLFLTKFKEKLMDGRNKVFKDLIKDNREIKTEEQNLRKGTKRALNRLIESFKNKQNRTLDRLLLNEVQKTSEYRIDSIKNSYNNIAKSRKNKGLCMLLVASLNEKTRRCLYDLRNHLRDKKEQEKRRREAMGIYLESLMENTENKKRECYKKIIENKILNDINDEKEFQIEEKKRNLMGVETNPNERQKFNNFLRNMRKTGVAGSGKITQHFENLKAYMEVNNDNGQYDKLLKLMDNGDIKNYEKLLDYILANNKDGIFDELKAQLDNQNLDMNLLKNFMNLNNEDGKYNDILDLIEKNPNFDRLELFSIIKKKNTDGKYNDLLKKMNNDKKIKDLIDFMKKNNEDGKYNNALRYLKKNPNPKISDFVKYVDRHNKDGEMNELIRTINQPKKGEKLFKKIVSFMKRNNGDRRYDPVLKFLLKRRNPKLSDITSFLVRNNGDGRYNPVMNKIDLTDKNPAEKFLEEVKRQNLDGEFTNFLEKNKGKKPSLYNIYKKLNSDDKNKRLNVKLLKIMENQDGIQKYVDFMNKNNDGGKYDELLHLVGRLKNPKKSDLIHLVNNNNTVDGNLNDLVGLLNKNEKMEPLIDFVKRKNKNGKYGEVLNLMKNNPSILHIVNSLLASNGDGEFTEILNKINGKEIDDPIYFDNLLNYLENSDDKTFKKMSKKLRELPPPELIKALELIEKHNKFNKFDDALEEADKTKEPKLLSDFRKFLNHNNRDGSLNSIKDFLEKNPDASLSKVVDFVDKNNKRGKLRKAKQFLNQEAQEDLLEEVTNYMLRNNDTGKYDEALKLINENDNLHLNDLMEFIKANNKTGKYKDLINKINEVEKEKPFQRINDFIKKNNKDKKYDDLLKSFKNRSNPSLNDVIEFAAENNKDGKYDDLIDKLLGRNINPEKLSKKLKMYNKSGVYTEVIDHINKNPNEPLYSVLEKIKQLNQNGKYKYLIQYINEGAEDDELLNVDTDSLFNFLLRAKKRGDCPKLISYIQKNRITNPNDILSYMKANNMDGSQYNGLISKFKSYCNNSFSQPLSKSKSGFDLITPFQKKMQICFKAMKSYTLISKNKETSKNNTFTKIFDKLFKNMNNKKKIALRNLMKNQQNKSKNETFKKLYSKKLFKLLKVSTDAKKKQCFNLLKKNNLDIIELSENKLNALRKVLTTLVNYCNKKKMVSLDNLRNNNYYKKKIMRKVGMALIKEHQNKKRYILNKLLDNMKSKKEREKIKVKCLRTIFINHAKKLQNALDNLRNYNTELKETKTSTNNFKSRAIILLRNALLNKERKCLKNLMKNNLVQKIKQITIKGVQKHLLQRLFSNIENKNRKCFNKLRNNLYQKNREKDKKNSILKRLAKNYKKNNFNVKRKILNDLRDYKNDQLGVEKKRNNLLSKLIQRLEDTSKRNIRTAMEEMRSNCEQSKLDQQKRNRGTKMLLSKIKNRYNNNIRDAFQKLKEYNRSKRETEMNNNKTTNAILRKFLGRQLRKTSSALSELRKNNREKKLEEENRIRSMRSFVNRFLQATQIKKRNALDKLIELKNEKEREMEIKNVKLTHMFNKLESRSRVKCASGLGKLFENREEDLKNRGKIKKMINRFYDKNRNKLRDIINTLRKNNIVKGHQNDIKLKTLSSLMNNTYKRCILKYFEKLVIHYMEIILKENKQSNAFTRIGIMKKFKSYRSLKELQKLNNNLIQKRMVFTKLFASSNSKKLKALETINKYTINRNRDITRATKLVKNNVLKDTLYFFKILKLNNFLINRNRVSTRLNNMIFCIRKNHRANLRTSIHHWAGTEYKNKVRLLREKLERLIMFKKINAYEAIKKKYLYNKFEKSIKGLMKLITLVEAKQMDNKEYFMKTFIDTFTDKNPWFKKTIHILAILSKPNDQIAFWRMRYAKNLRKEGLSAEQTLKLKKVFYIVNREIQKNLSHSFWKINAFADKSLSQTQTGFGSMMKKY